MNTSDLVAVTSRSFSKNEKLIEVLQSKYKKIKLNQEGLSLSGESLISFCNDADKVIVGLEIFNSKILEKLPNLKVYAINMEKPNIKKVQNFYNDLKINNIKIYFDPEFNLAKKFRMRGLPTTIFIDKSGNEFARAIGEIDFNSKKLIELLEKKINL